MQVIQSFPCWAYCEEIFIRESLCHKLLKIMNCEIVFYPQWETEHEQRDCKILNENPWRFSDGKQLSFISLPTVLDTAVTMLNGRLDIFE